MDIILRDYQKECINKLASKNFKGKYLVQMATGCGKTATFSQLINHIDGRMLILSHREELVKQPKKFFKCSYGIEQGKNKSNGERVVSASVQTMVRRLENFKPDDFQIIVVDEAHHAAAKTYRKILDYFENNLTCGFTATPNREDDLSLESIFDEIIFEYDLIKAIKNNYLCNIKCTRVHLDYDLSKVRKNTTDYNAQDLEEEMIEHVDATVKAIEKYSTGQTLIFACSVDHANQIHDQLKDSIVVTGKTANRDKIIDDFTNRKFQFLINCMVFTEGTDIPLIETIVNARPTKNQGLYTQIVGRGLRLHKDKEHLNLIDLVGCSTDLNLCVAPTLVGIEYDDSEIDETKDKEYEEMNLFDLPELIEERQDNIKYWKLNHKKINIWAKKRGYKLHNINYYKRPDGSMILTIKQGMSIEISKINELGELYCCSRKYKAQNFFDMTFKRLNQAYQDSSYMWDLKKVKRWGSAPISEKQRNIILQHGYHENDVNGMTKIEASQVLNHLFNRR